MSFSTAWLSHERKVPQHAGSDACYFCTYNNNIKDFVTMLQGTECTTIILNSHLRDAAVPGL